MMMMKMRRKVGTLGCVWLLIVPLMVFSLCLLLHLHHYLPPLANTTLLRRSTLCHALSASLYSKLTNLYTPVAPMEHVNPVSRLLYWERKTTDNYLRVQLALAESSGSLATPRGPPLADVGTLKDLRTFQPLLTPREKAQLLYAFELFSAVCQNNNLRFFLANNSLLGSLRHHGVIPWSDVSITVSMRAEDQALVRKVLDSREDVTLMWSNPYAWSLRLRHTRPDPPDLLRMTYISIQFYRENSTHLWAETWGNKRLFTAAKERVFPLALRPFEGQLVPVPCDVSSVMEQGDAEQCRAVLEDEEEMVFRDAGLLPCSVLSKVFPFVGRRLAMAPGRTVEQVLVNGTLLYTALVETGWAG